MLQDIVDRPAKLGRPSRAVWKEFEGYGLVERKMYPGISKEIRVSSLYGVLGL
jgi:hypothetical protein